MIRIRTTYRLLVSFIWLFLLQWFWAPNLLANPTLNETATNAQVMTQLQGQGVTLNNFSVVTGDSAQFGTYTGGNSSTTPGPQIGIEDGVFMSTSRANTLVGTNPAVKGPNDTGGISDDMGLTYTDPELTSIDSGAIYDPVIIQMQATPIGSFLKITFVFASDEYPEYTCTYFNDVFGMFIKDASLPDTPANWVNIATLPGTTTPIAVNTINNGTCGDQHTPGSNDAVGALVLTNSQYYVDNGDGSTPGNNTNLQYDGFTIPFIVETPVTANTLYDVKIALADAGDGWWDGALFVKDISSSNFSADADLELGLQANNTNPNTGDTVIFTLTVDNKGQDAATGVQASFQLPAGFNYVSDTSGGNYNSATGIWTIPSSLAALTGTTSIQISTTAGGSGSINAFAEISTANVNDIDSTPGNGTQSPVEDDEDTVTLNITAFYDYSDAPNDLSAIDADMANAYPTLISDNGASHTLDGVTFLGAAVDADSDGQPTGAADGDNDDGVSFPTLGTSDVFLVGQSNSITVTASVPGFLNVWIDSNQDGDWDDSGEQLFTNQALNAGSNVLTYIPTNTQPSGDTYLRFRFTSATVTSPVPTGNLPDGEVEDYRVSIVLPEAGSCSSGLINGDFENPAIGFGQFSESSIPGWATISSSPTAGSNFSERNNIEIWNSGFNGVPSYEGNQFAEINSYVFGTLYQDLETTPGSVINFRFAHRGREGSDTVDVLIGPPTATVSQTGSVGYTTGNTAWSYHTGAYTVPAGQTITRFSFQAISTASVADSVGNFIDAVEFGYLCNEDYSDTPIDGSVAPSGSGATAYGQAKHTIVSGIHLGGSVDNDASSIASSDASGDGADDDGLITLPTLTEAAAYTLQVVVTGSGTLSGWIDYNGDGIFDADDTITGNLGVASTGGTVDLPIHVPANSAGTTFLRLRYSSDAAALAVDGAATDGEVEDYQITILPKITNPANPGTTPEVNGVCTVYNATGADQLITAPVGAQGLSIKMWGAGGGHEIVGTGYSGAGGYSEAQFDSSVITPGDIFSLVVGRGGNTSGRPDEFTPSSIYGFGSVSGHDQGGGLTGLFTGNTAVTETDQARALIVSGGGAGYENSGGGTGTNGGNGNSASAGGQPNMRGSTDVSPAYNNFASPAHRGGGGGGYYGGGRSPAPSSNYSNVYGSFQTTTAGASGGSGYIAPSAVAGRLLSMPDGTSNPPNTSDSDYITGIGVGSSSTTTTAGGNGLAVLCWELIDYSDAPNNYGNPSHSIDNSIKLGAVVDAELAATPSTAANSDGTDDDGVAVLPVISELDRSYRLTVNATNTSANPGRLIAWIDFDLSGTFDADEAAVRVVPSGTTAGDFVVAWSNIPPDIQAGTSYLRLRFTTDSLNAGEATGVKSNGEVEDYLLTIDSGGLVVSGNVYIDANRTQTRETSEAGIVNTVVVLRDTSLGTCQSATTAVNGDYLFTGVLDSALGTNYEVYQVHGETTPTPSVCDSVTINPAGFNSTTPDALSITVTNTNVTDQDFGEIWETSTTTPENVGIGIAFEPDHQGEVLPGNVIYYAHTLTAEAGGEVSFTSAAIGNVPNGWTHVLYQDDDCNGILDGVEANTLLGTAGIAIAVSDQLCLINKIYAPANVPARERYEVMITAVAEFDFSAGFIPSATLTVTDLTIAGQTVSTTPGVGESKLELIKTVQNLTIPGSLETQGQNQGSPGDELKYRIYYRNTGTGPINNLKINDTVPAYTGLIANSVTCIAPPPPSGMSCSSIVASDEISWDFTGALVGGSKGEVSYEVMVDK